MIWHIYHVHFDQEFGNPASGKIAVQLLIRTVCFLKCCPCFKVDTTQIWIVNSKI
jgi:hypothetical protein